MLRTTRDTPTAGSGAPACRWWVAALFLVLAGLFGMHGLAGHGTGDPAAMPGMAIASGPTGPSAAGGTDAGAGRHAAQPTVPPGAAAARADGGGVGPVAEMGLCLAVLAAGLLLLVLLLARRADRSAVRVRLRPLPALGLGRRRDRAPRMWLSVCRC